MPWRRVCLCILCNLPFRWLNNIKVSILHSASDPKTAQAQLSQLLLINCTLQLPPTSTALYWTYISLLCPCPSCTRELRTGQQYFRHSLTDAEQRRKNSSLGLPAAVLLTQQRKQAIVFLWWKGALLPSVHLLPMTMPALFLQNCFLAGASGEKKKKKKQILSFELFLCKLSLS